MAIVTCPNCGTKNRLKDDSTQNQKATCGKCGTPIGLATSGDDADFSTPIYVTDSNFEQTLAAAGSIPVMIDCWAPWCGPCRMIGPIMEQLARESRGRYRIGKLNVDDNPRTSARFQISSIPTMLLFKNGNLVDRVVGALPKEAIAARLSRA